VVKRPLGPGFTHARSSVTNLQAHVIFVVKYRRKVLTSRILNDCHAIMTETASGLGCQVREFNGEADHVHLIVQYPPTVAVADLVRTLKGTSSRRLREQHAAHLRRYLWGDHLWSPSYFAASAGGVTLDVLKRYIDGQARPD